MSNELKPCPFCGGNAVVNGDGNAECGDCFVESLTDWNTRPIEDALRARIAELEESIEMKNEATKATIGIKNKHIAKLVKQAIVWHRYPDEKPEKPNWFTGMWMDVLAIDECGCILIGTCRFIGNELDLLAPQPTKYWAYLPEPPREEG